MPAYRTITAIDHDQVVGVGRIAGLEGEYEFGGLEWWNGAVEWTTGVEYWTGLLECHAHKCTIWSNSMAKNLISKC